MLGSSWVPSQHGIINGQRPASPGLGAILGPALLGGAVAHDDFEQNNVAAATQIPGWVSVVAAASVYTPTVPAFTASPSVRGYIQWVLTDDPAVPGKAGWRRQQAYGMPRNAYGSIFETWIWMRWRMLTVEPTAALDYYASPGGIANQAGGVVEPTDGIGVVYDRTLGVASWVVRAWRSGVAIQATLSEPWVVGTAANDVGWLSALIRHQGAQAFVYAGDPRTGTPLTQRGILSGAELQPALDVTPYYGHLLQLTAALGYNPTMQSDYYGWGSPGR